MLDAENTVLLHSTITAGGSASKQNLGGWARGWGRSGHRRGAFGAGNWRNAPIHPAKCALLRIPGRARGPQQGLLSTASQTPILLYFLMISPMKNYLRDTPQMGGWNRLGAWL
jgi:hypothetical protein